MRVLPSAALPRKGSPSAVTPGTTREGPRSTSCASVQVYVHECCRSWVCTHMEVSSHCTCCSSPRLRFYREPRQSAVALCNLVAKCQHEQCCSMSTRAHRRATNQEVAGQRHTQNIRPSRGGSPPPPILTRPYRPLNPPRNGIPKLNRSGPSCVACAWCLSRKARMEMNGSTCPLPD